MRTFVRPLIAATALLAVSAGPLAAQTPAAAPAAQAPATAAAPVTEAERRAVVEQLAERLEAMFVFPETGKRYAAALRSHLAGGAYDALSAPDAFAARLTQDLQAVARDGHLRVQLRGPRGGPAPAPGARPERPQAIAHSGWITPGVAYIAFNRFAGGEETTAAVRKFMLEHADARAVIIDARAHRGGGMDEMNAMLPLLYAAPTTLVRMDVRADVDGEGPVRDGPTLLRRPSPATVVSRDHVVTPDASERRLQDAQVFYLTSGRTASAAEHLALAFKRTGRATLVGETTRGAGHFGGMVPVGERFAAFIPAGRTYDPDTGQGWEAVGVSPDVAVPADAALERALQLAGVAPGAVAAAVAAAKPAG